MRKEEKAFKKGYRIDSNGKIIGLSGSEIFGKINNNGYREFGFRFEKKVVKLYFHRLQAYQKYADKLFEDGLVCRHIDNDKLNNSYDNIVIGTHSENMMDKPRHMRLSCAIYASSFIKKHDHDSINDFYVNCNSYSKTMKEFNISSKGTLHFILNKYKEQS